MPSNYTLDEHCEEFIKNQVAGGRYASASEVVRDALRLLEEEERERLRESEEIKQAIAESRHDTRPSVPADEVLDRLQAKYRNMIPSAPVER
ncbi:MAG: type II toxin-antitoxin system ParD family antitoxin [Burkholderiales bacterium]